MATVNAAMRTADGKRWNRDMLPATWVRLPTAMLPMLHFILLAAQSHPRSLMSDDLYITIIADLNL